MPALADISQRFTVERKLIGPEQIILRSYSPSYDDEGNERNETPEEAAKDEVFRADVRARQLHQFRVVVTDNQPPISRKTIQSPLFEIVHQAAAEIGMDIAIQELIDQRYAGAR